MPGLMHFVTRSQEPRNDTQTLHKSSMLISNLLSSAYLSLALAKE
jgi:hypothetical protein